MRIDIPDDGLPNALQGVEKIATKSAQKAIDAKLSDTIQNFLIFTTSALLKLVDPDKRRPLNLTEQIAMAKEVIAILDDTTTRLKDVLKRTIDPSKQEIDNKFTDIPLETLLIKIRDIDMKNPAGNFKEHGTSELTTRMKNALADNKIHYLGDLILRTVEELSSMPDVGPACTKAIIRTLKTYRLKLGTQLDPIAKANFERAKSAQHV